MATFNLDIDFHTAMMARIYQSAGMAFLFVPINVMAFYFIPKEKFNNATGIINLARNIGGSFGIANVVTLLARRTQFHQGMLVSHMTPFDSAYRAHVERFGGHLVRGRVQFGRRASPGEWPGLWNFAAPRRDAGLRGRFLDDGLDVSGLDPPDVFNEEGSAAQRAPGALSIRCVFKRDHSGLFGVDTSKLRA